MTVLHIRQLLLLWWNVLMGWTKKWGQIRNACKKKKHSEKLDLKNWFLKKTKSTHLLTSKMFIRVKMESLFVQIVPAVFENASAISWFKLFMEKILCQIKSQFSVNEWDSFLFVCNLVAAKSWKTSPPKKRKELHLYLFLLGVNLVFDFRVMIN